MMRGDTGTMRSMPVLVPPMGSWPFHASVMSMHWPWKSTCRHRSTDLPPIFYPTEMRVEARVTGREAANTDGG